jgi:adenylylsulfate kinase-like enzyme
MGKIYWFTGQPGSGKTVLGKKLVNLLQTERRNWRKDVFHINDEELKNLTLNNDTTHITQIISEYLSNNTCDVVVSIVSPNKILRDNFKQKIGLDRFQEFYVYTSTSSKSDVSEYEIPTENYFSIDTTKDNPDQSFTKIVNYLKDTEKL